MKILHILNNYLPHQIAGTEVYVSALARELKLKQVESVIVIPNNKNKYEEYLFEDIRVIKYAEFSVADREIITGLKAPLGLNNYLEILILEKPDIVHFHELAGSIGVGIFHLRATKNLGFKIVITLHLAKYSCQTGTLMYMNNAKCDGVIRNIKCSKCWLNNMGEDGFKASIITFFFTLFYIFNFDSRFLKNSLGTALSLPNIIGETRSRLLELENLSSKIIVLTNWYRNILVNNGITESHISVIDQGIPNPFIQTKIREKSLPVLRLIYVGRISHFKGVDILIKCVNEINSEKIFLDIYGSATEEKYFNYCMKLLDDKSNISWKGDLHPNLVLSTIGQYDVLCIPSMVAEMGPFVLKEAFAAGTPVLASDVYGNSEQIQHNVNGWLFKFKNIVSLKHQLIELMNNPDLIQFARNNIKPIRSFEGVAQDQLVIYQSILDVS